MSRACKTPYHVTQYAEQVTTLLYFILQTDLQSPLLLGRNSILNASHIIYLPVHTWNTHSYIKNKPQSTQTGHSVGAVVRNSSCSVLQLA